MARLIRPLRKSFLFHSSSSIFKIQTSRLQRQPFMSQFVPALPPQSSRINTNMYDYKLSLVDEKLIRIIRHEIQYELERLPITQPGMEYESFAVDGLPGEKYMTLRRKFGEDEDIRIEATMFDRSLPDPKSPITKARKLRISLVISISKEGSSNELEISCWAWPRSIKIDKLGIRKPGQSSYFSPYFKDLDDKLIDALYVFLGDRGIDDHLAVFLHNYVKNKEEMEYIRWLETMKGFVETS